MTAINNMDTMSAGITGGNPVPMTTAARVTPVTERTYGIAATIMDIRPGNAADIWSAYIAFDWPTLYILMECWANNLDVQFSADGGASYEGIREVGINRAALVPFTATGFRVRNTTPGSISRYQLTGMGTGF